MTVGLGLDLPLGGGRHAICQKINLKTWTYTTNDDIQLQVEDVVEVQLAQDLPGADTANIQSDKTITRRFNIIKRLIIFIRTKHTEFTFDDVDGFQSFQRYNKDKCNKFMDDFLNNQIVTATHGVPITKPNKVMGEVRVALTPYGEVDITTSTGTDNNIVVTFNGAVNMVEIQNALKNYKFNTPRPGVFVVSGVKITNMTKYVIGIRKALEEYDFKITDKLALTISNLSAKTWTTNEKNIHHTKLGLKGKQICALSEHWDDMIKYMRGTTPSYFREALDGLSNEREPQACTTIKSKWDSLRNPTAVKGVSLTTLYAYMLLVTSYMTVALTMGARSINLRNSTLSDYQVIREKCQIRDCPKCHISPNHYQDTLVYTYKNKKGKIASEIPVSIAIRPHKDATQCPLVAMALFIMFLYKVIGQTIHDTLPFYNVMQWSVNVHKRVNPHTKKRYGEGEQPPPSTGKDTSNMISSILEAVSIKVSGANIFVAQKLHAMRRMTVSKLGLEQYSIEAASILCGWRKGMCLTTYSDTVIIALGNVASYGIAGRSDKGDAPDYMWSSLDDIPETLLTIEQPILRYMEKIFVLACATGVAGDTYMAYFKEMNSNKDFVAFSKLAKSRISRECRNAANTQSESKAGLKRARNSAEERGDRLFLEKEEGLKRETTFERQQIQLVKRMRRYEPNFALAHLDVPEIEQKTSTPKEILEALLADIVLEGKVVGGLRYKVKEIDYPKRCMQQYETIREALDANTDKTLPFALKKDSRDGSLLLWVLILCGIVKAEGYNKLHARKPNKKSWLRWVKDLRVRSLPCGVQIDSWTNYKTSTQIQH
jgi:hypothetical protein